MAYVTGIDIGGTNFRIGNVDDSERIASFQKIPVADVFCTDDAMADLTRFLRGWLGLYCQGEKPSAISIGFPATLNKMRDVVVQAPNVKNIENLPIKDYLERELGIPVLLERDVTMILCYDMKKAGCPDDASAVGIYFGTGIGSAIYMNGSFIAGKNGAAGELGHIPVDGCDEICGCGNTGCLETVAGGKYLDRLSRSALRGTPVGELFTRHADHPLLLQFVDRMAMGVSVMLNILDPDYILLGGEIPGMDGFPADYLMKQIRLHARKPYPERNMEIVITDDIPEKGVCGAAMYAFRLLGSDSYPSIAHTYILAKSSIK